MDLLFSAKKVLREESGENLQTTTQAKKLSVRKVSQLHLRSQLTNFAAYKLFKLCAFFFPELSSYVSKSLRVTRSAFL